MATTPPLRISVQTPPTPRHGPLQDRYPNASRHSARLADKRRVRDNHSTPEPESPVKPRSGRSAVISTPSSGQRSPGNTANNNLSPPQSYKASPKRKGTRRVHIISPDSPLDNTFGGSEQLLPPSNGPSHQSHSTFLTATTTSTGMLPTPVKTPKKKKMASNVDAPARTLFESQPVIGEEVQSAPKRGRKGRKYNGFSLESFSAEDDGHQSNIQIFTDSKEKVPELDLSEENPFIDHAAFDRGSSSKKVGGTSKRRKISGERRKDRDVQEAIEKDEGMVYVFRGRKLYRKFNETDDAEEAAESPIDVSDLGLLSQSSNPNEPTPTQMRKLRPLTRKSVKPTRLFQSEKQKRNREAKKEEEVATDIEDAFASSPTAMGTPTGLSPTLVDVKNAESDEEKPSEVIRKRGKKVSPFDTWKRVKRGSGETSATTKGKKRDLDEVSGEQVTKKKTRA